MIKTPLFVPQCYEQIIAELGTDEMNAFINSLPSECHETMDRLLYEQPITNDQDNWILRMGKLRSLDRTAAIQLIRSWKIELGRVAIH